MSTIVFLNILPDNFYKLKINTVTNKERIGCKYFRAFNTVLYKKILLQPVLWNKRAPLKEQGYNGFPEINIPFNFFQINLGLLPIMIGCKESCEINTVQLIYGSIQVLPWNNTTTIEKIDSCDWRRKLTDFFQYMHS